jgi:geranylgeranylglycerol-phosphate geranylgeranyltransferase
MISMQRISLVQKLGGLVRLFRPELPLAAAVCVLIGEVLALGAIPPVRILGLGFLSGFLLSASALITNDYFDIEVDRVNAPGRPLPSGVVTPPEVMALGILTGIAGMAAAWAISPPALVLSAVMWVAGFLYNWKLKSAGLWGNLVVSTSVAATFVLGGIAAGGVWDRAVWVFGLIAFLFDLAEEIAGDAMDAEGDRLRGSKSIAITMGRAAALRLSGLLFAAVIALTAPLILWGGAHWRSAIILPLMDVLVAVLAIHLLRSHTPTEGRRAMKALYLSGSAGLLAFLIGAFVS